MKSLKENGQKFDIALKWWIWKIIPGLFFTISISIIFRKKTLTKYTIMGRATISFSSKPLKPGITHGIWFIAVTFYCLFYRTRTLTRLQAVCNWSLWWFSFALIIYFGNQYEPEIGGFMTIWKLAFNLVIAILILWYNWSSWTDATIPCSRSRMPGVLADAFQHHYWDDGEFGGFCMISLPPEHWIKMKQVPWIILLLWVRLKHLGLKSYFTAIICPLILGAIP